MLSLQAGAILLLDKRGYFLKQEDFRAAWRVIRNIQSSGFLPKEEFGKLQDLDHDSGDSDAACSDDFDEERWNQIYGIDE